MCNSQGREQVARFEESLKDKTPTVIEFSFDLCATPVPKKFTYNLPKEKVMSYWKVWLLIEFIACA